MKHTLVVATHNQGKLRELRELLSGMNVEVCALRDVLGYELDIVEDGTTFEANAVKKAEAAFAKTAMLCLADDSGLEVDALGGAPGVHSARYAGERATCADNNAKLLEDLARSSTPPPEGGWKARFRCTLALIDPYANGGLPYVVEGVCEGKVVQTARGNAGFGYDPLFVVEGTSRTMAELDPSEKNELSHRAEAFRKLRLVLEKLIAVRNELARGIEQGPPARTV